MAELRLAHHPNMRFSYSLFSRTMTLDRSVFLSVAMFSMISALPAAAQVPESKKPAEHLHQSGKFRVFYETEGKNAVELADANQNRVPDQVEDVLTQARGAWMLLVDTLEFPDPFKTERFREASFLDIRFRHRDVLGSSGKAYDELQRSRRAYDPPGTRTLSFNVATSVHAATNLTPAHELFHIIQYSTTYFKNRWFTEGTARWSEKALGTGGLGPVRYRGPWPLAEKERTELFETTYDASGRFWNALAIEDDPEGAIPESAVSSELKELTYVNGEKVLKDLRLNGWRLMREVLNGLNKADDIAFRELGYDRWSEANQTSPKNSPFILKTVMEIVEARKTKKS